MTRRTLGLSMVGLGLAMVAIGIVALAGPSDEEPETSPTTTTAAATTTTVSETTTIPETTTTAPSTTTTTTTATTTTTTTAPPSVEDFVAEYATATESGDSSFLFERLLPGVRAAFGQELCQAWVDREILAISNYQLTGDVAGPESRTLVVGEAEIRTSQYFEGPISFDFQGQSFDTTAQWVVEDGQVYWIGECR